MISIAATVAAFPAAAQNPGGGGAVAILANVRGSVRIQRDGSVLWETAQDGAAIDAKTKVKTAGESGAVIKFTDGGYVKLTPFGTALIDRIDEVTGKQSDVVLLESGRVWATAKPGDKTERMILETPGGAVDIREGAVFLESDPVTHSTCVDVFSGAAGARSLADPSKVSKIDTNKRTNIRADQPPTDPVAIDGVFDTENTEYTCLAPANGSNKVTMGNSIIETTEDTPEYSLLRVSAAGQVEFTGGVKKNVEQTSAVTPAIETVEEEEGNVPVTISAASTVTFQKCAATGAACEENDDCCGGLCDESLCAEQKGTETLDNKGMLVFPVETSELQTEFEVIQVQKTTTVTFTETKCQNPPSIEAVAIGDKNLSEGETAAVEGAECAATAKPQITFTVSPKCGSITTLTAKSGAESKNLGTVGQGQTSAFSAILNLQDTSPLPVEIYAADSFNNSTTFKFSAQMQLNESLTEQPSVSSVMINGQPVNAGDRAEITFDSCGETTLNLAGKTATKCGRISSVSLNKDGASQRVAGTTAWSSSISLPLTSSEAAFDIKTKNSLGVENEPFAFEVKITRELAPPTVSFITIGGKPINDSSEPIDLYRDQLESGKIAIQGAAESSQCTLSKVEVSTNDGSSWAAAAGTTAWSYSFQPSEQTYKIRARAVDAAGTVSEEAMNTIEALFHNATPEDDLLDVFKRLIQAYLNKNISGFTQLTSQDYNSSYEGIEDVNSLDTSLDNKFTANPVMYLRYQVSSTTITGDNGQVSFSWSADQSTSGYSESAVFQFAREEEGWKFITVRDDRTFLRYTSIAASVALRAADSEIIADNTDNTTITAEVRDSAHNLIKDDTKVRFSTTLGTITASAATRNGIAEATLFGENIPGNASVSATCGSITATPIVVIIKREHAPACLQQYSDPTSCNANPDCKWNVIGNFCDVASAP
jgi:hypothetical protein